MQRWHVIALFACLALLSSACTDIGDNVGTTTRPAAVHEHMPPANDDGHWQGDSAATALEQGRATLQFAYVPATGFAGRDGAGRPDGATVALLRDFAHWLAREHGIEVTVQWREQADWSRFYRQVRDGEGGVFGVGNVTITDARKDELDFSPPYMRNVAVLVTHEREPELAAMDAIGQGFAGMSALVFPGTLHEVRLREIADKHFGGALPLHEHGSNDAIVQALVGDGRHFAYLDAYNLHRAVQEGQPLRRHAVGDDASETFGVILPHGSDWTPLLRAFFATDGGYIRSPRWREHLSAHLGTELASVLLD